MMREIVFDTETTGLRPEEGERIIEIGAVELLHRVPTGRSFHEYLNPEDRKVHPDALQIHGLSDAFLADKKPFRAICDAFLEFVGDAHLVAHNASFDMNFLNHELARLNRPPFDPGRVVDTLEIARRKHPMAQNSLDRLCERYGIDNSRRTKHGALLDSELLAEVYVELLGGRQTTLELVTVTETVTVSTQQGSETIPRPERIRPLASRLTEDDRLAHQQLVDTLGEDALWKRYQ